MKTLSSFKNGFYKNFFTRLEFDPIFYLKLIINLVPYFIIFLGLEILNL